MAAILHASNSTKPTSLYTESCPISQGDATDNESEVQYRQLVSRAVTQRLHSPSLGDFTKTDMDDRLAHTLESWETQERRIARDKARTQAEMLGIPWTQFVRDVESATLEVHVLTPTRYEAPPRNKKNNEEASKTNSKLVYEFCALEGLEQNQERRRRDAAVYNMLRAFQRGRPGG